MDEEELLLYIRIVENCSILIGHRAAEAQQQVTKELKEWGFVGDSVLRKDPGKIIQCPCYVV